MKKLLLILSAVVIASGCTTEIKVNTPQQERKTAVTDVVDGDTVDIQLNNSEETVRLLGVDTPEVHIETQPEEYENIPDNERGRQCLEKYGKKASNFAKEKLSDQKVKFVTDPQSDVRGSYGRLLGYIKVNSTNFNYKLVEKGLARVYESEFSQKQRFMEAQKEAENSMEGLWKCQTFELRNISIE